MQPQPQSVVKVEPFRIGNSRLYVNQRRDMKSLLNSSMVFSKFVASIAKETWLPVPTGSNASDALSKGYSDFFK